jgi:xanthine dehydrogenase YagT iron-sulfur-binding subunit
MSASESSTDTVVVSEARTITGAFGNTPSAADGTLLHAAAPVLEITLDVNGRISHQLVDPRVSLLDVLADRLGLTGTKKGCNQGACGSCTVLLNGKRINACLTLAVMHDGASITTIEGLEKDGELHPLQQAFIQHDAFQCGYCTPGQIISGSACIDEGHARSADEIKTWMSGNICRCGAYPQIVTAIAEIAGKV